MTGMPFHEKVEQETKEMEISFNPERASQIYGHSFID
jgi:hypothetical protein